MKDNVTYVARIHFENLIREAGLVFLEQSHCLKVTLPGGRLYVASTKRVGLVDLSGFEIPLDQGLTKDPHYGKGGNGRVLQQLRFDGTEEDVLLRFERVLQILKSLPAPAPIERKVKAKKSDSVPDSSPVSSPDDNPGEKLRKQAERLALITKVAQEKGVGISPMAFNEEA